MKVWMIQRARTHTHTHSDSKTESPREQTLVFST